MTEIHRSLALLSGTAQIQLWDPCAGEGEAILELATLVLTSEPSLKVHLCLAELSPARASVLETNCTTAVAQFGDRLTWQVAQGDAFMLPNLARSGSLLYLNPPFDTDPVCGRLEARWIKHFIAALQSGREGSGVLVFVIPPSAVEACGTLLDTFFERLSIRHVEGPQGPLLIVMAVACRFRTSMGKSFVDLAAEGTDVGTNVVYTVPPATSPIPSSWEIARVDSKRFAAQFAPWHATERGLVPIPKMTCAIPLAEVNVQRFMCASDPRPGHIAAAIACGAFDGVLVEPNPEGVPSWAGPIYVKGIFGKELVSEGFTELKEGEVRERLREAPRLRAMILETEGYQTFELKQDLDPSDSPKSWEEASVGDLLLWYGKGLLEAFQRRCYPRFPELPELKGACTRKLFPAQEKLVRGGVAFLHQVGAALIQGETGVGKTQMGLATLGEFGSRRTLVMAPPALLSPRQWPAQIAACFPEAKIFFASDITSLRAYEQAVQADPQGHYVLLLNRNDAKLGYPREGITGRCPACHTKIETSPDTLAGRKARCGARLPKLSPKLRQIVHILWPLSLEDSMLSSLGPAKGRHHKAKKVDPHRLDPLLVDLVKRAAILQREHPTWTSAIYWLRQHGATMPKPEWQKVLSMLEYHKLWRERMEEIVLGPQVQSAMVADDVFALFLDSPEIEHSVCNEPLWTAGPSQDFRRKGTKESGLRRVPLAKQLLGLIRSGLVDSVILDEFHELANLNSAQSKAAWLLLEQKIPRVLLTGSLANGYAWSIFLALWATSPDFRRKYGRKDMSKFLEQCGFQKGDRILKGQTAAALQLQAQDKVMGKSSNRVIKGGDFRPTAPAPGVMPNAILTHLLAGSLTLTLADLGLNLPPKRPTEVIYLPMLPEQKAATDKLFQLVASCIEKDLSKWKGKTKMLGALMELLSAPDRLLEDVIGPSWDILHTPADGSEKKLVGSVASMPKGTTLPKEEKLLEILQRELDEGRRVLIFAHHRDLFPRILRIAQRVDPKAVYMDAKKVAPEDRPEWIDEIVRQGSRVLIGSPIALGTGIDTLVPFATQVWFQPPPKCQPTVKRQADGRAHRIGQDQECRSYMLAYDHPRTRDEIGLLFRKIAVSEAVDGHDAASALRASGASGEDEAMTADLARFIWERMRSSQKAA